MICLKNRTFAVSQTSPIIAGNVSFVLWFAWKIVLLQYHKHRNRRSNRRSISCDLLEKSYFCSITNIGKSLLTKQFSVVICLKNRTFAVSQTSDATCPKTDFSCDLLEKSYFCSITNIPRQLEVLRFGVVICLKNRTFAVSQTSTHQNTMLLSMLWFAWKIVLLQYHKHQQEQAQNDAKVVICLKNRTFAVSQTSGSEQERQLKLLWFAWKIVLLQYHKHLSNLNKAAVLCCDLLEKSYFCSITNIGRATDNCVSMVVICLKNRTFAVSQTSPEDVEVMELALWFAWKIVLLQYHKHQNITKPYQVRVVICLKNRTFAVSQTSNLQ